MFSKKVVFLDPLLVEKQEQIFYINNIKQGDIIFDIGANVGELSILYSRFTGIEGQVHSFEPTPQTFKKLSSVMENTNKKNVFLNNLIVTDKSGFMDFNVYQESHAAWNTLANRPLEKYNINIDKPEIIKLPTITIDAYCEEKKIKKIDLLKIDVEGAELNVLKGAAGMFKDKKIKICVFEFGQTIHDMGNNAKDFIDFFRDYHYKVQNIVENQIVFPVDKKSNIAQFSVHFAKPLK